MPKTEPDEVVAYLPLDAFIGDDADVVFGHPCQFARSEEDHGHRSSWTFSVSLCHPLSFKVDI
jgi:hypothetical protein